MWSFVALSHLLTITTCAVLQPQQVSYDGYKVVRVSVGDDVDKVRSVVADLGLATWKGMPRAGAFADIVVPPHHVEDFVSRIADLSSTTMHHDLGAAMAEEAQYQIYVGTCVIRPPPHENGLD